MWVQALIPVGTGKSIRRSKPILWSREAKLHKPVSIGVHVPSVSVSGLADGAAYAAYFKLVEDVGLDAVWVEDRIFHPAHLADSLGRYQPHSVGHSCHGPKLTPRTGPRPTNRHAAASFGRTGYLGRVHRRPA